MCVNEKVSEDVGTYAVSAPTITSPCCPPLPSRARTQSFQIELIGKDRIPSERDFHASLSAIYKYAAEAAVFQRTSIILCSILSLEIV